MKFEGLHGQEAAKRRTGNLVRVNRKKSWWIGFSEDDAHRQRPIIIATAPHQKPGGKAAFAHALRTTRSTWRLRSRAQRNHLPQHAKAVAEKANFTAFGMVPTHWNFANPQTRSMREIEQLHVECEAVDPRRFKNRPARLKAKRFKSALRVPKR